MSKLKVSKTCGCSNKSKSTCPNCSSIKMVILLKNGFNHLKIANGTKLYNPVWYSYIKEESKTQNTIINMMFRRFSESIYSNATTMVIFYHNETKSEISRIRI